MASWFETRQRVRAKRGPMINSDALLTMRVSDLILRSIAKRCVSKDEAIDMEILHKRTFSVPRPISPQRLKGQTLADRAKGVAVNDTGRRHCLGDRLADMGEPHRAAGQEHRVDIVGG